MDYSSSKDSDQEPIGVTNDAKNDDDEIDVQEWLNKILKAEQKEENWRDRAKRCIKIYRDDNTVTSNTYASPRPYDDNNNTFNILWANVETLQPALFSNVPKPDIRNRYLATDPNAEQVGVALERCLMYSLDTYNFIMRMKSAIKDYLLTGRAVVRVRLIPIKDKQNVPILDENDQPFFDALGDQLTTEEEVMVDQNVQCEVVDYDKFIVEPTSRWDDVTWIAFEHYLEQDDFDTFFPDAPEIAAAEYKDRYTLEPKYKVYEVWDKKTKKIYFLGQAEKPLKVMDDPLQLTHFFPIPEPLYSIKTNDSLVPIPEYTIYQSQAYELNQISYRISDLVKSCKMVGLYDSQQQGMGDILKGRDSQFFPVQGNALRQSGGMKGMLDILDVSPIARILQQLYEQRDQIKGIIYEVTGISDIIRGDSKASETATAQNIKARYAGLRLRDRRDNIDRFIVDLLRIKTELIARFFAPDKITKMSGIELTPEMVSLLRSDIQRQYRIDIETDSTILADMDLEAQKRASLVSSITQYITSVAPLVGQGILPIETAKALLKYAVTTTKIPKELEDSLELIGAQMTQQMPGQPPQPMQQGVPPRYPHPAARHPIQRHAPPIIGPTSPQQTNLPPGLT